MSIKTYNEAKRLILNNIDGKAYYSGEQDRELIRLAEEKLGINFYGIYLDFLQTFGSVDYGMHEVYGIIGEDLETPETSNAIGYNLEWRNTREFPKYLFFIYHTGDDEVFCLDFNQLNEDGEPKIVSYFPGWDEVHQTFEVIADDFGDFLMDLIREEDEMGD